MTVRTPSCLYGLGRWSLSKPLGQSICLALEPRHLLTAIVRLCQMTSQDPHGEPWSTVMCVCTRTIVHMFVTAFKGRGERGQVLALATVFVLVTGSGSNSGQKTCREPLCHPSRLAWVTSSHSNNSLLGLWFTESLSDYRRFQRQRSVFCSQKDL